MVWLSTRERHKNAERVETMVDKLGRVFVRMPHAMQPVRWVSFDGETFYEVEKTEERFSGQHLTTLVCYLRRD
jgi:hypothetical protein